MGFIGSLVPVAAAVIRDLMNSNGLLRSFTRKMLPKAQTKQGQAVDAPYTIIEDKGANNLGKKVGEGETGQKKRITP
jgi:hypothetical protein